MALTVKHLNADTTFLLTFSPAFAPPHADTQFPGSFTILIDPWLDGPSSIWNPKFQISHHTTESCVKSLTDLPEPNLIIVSQDKPDHCHRETLCSLPAHSHIRILATPAAAKKIISWNHFKNASIESMQPYNASSPKTIQRIPVPSYTRSSAPGEITIAYLPAKMDVTRLHNAIGITYRAPGSQTTAPSGTVVDLPLSPPASPGSSPTVSRPRTAERSVSFSADPSGGLLTPPPDTPSTGQMHDFPLMPTREKTLSVLYSPHGVSMSAISPYASAHLAKESALPLTALFHSINTEENPWFMGGQVAAGYPGGANIVRKLGAQCWISAHDEVKDNRGWSVAFIKSTRYTMEDVQKKLEEDVRSYAEKKNDQRRRVQTMVVSLDPGQQMRIPQGPP